MCGTNFPILINLIVPFRSSRQLFTTISDRPQSITIIFSSPNYHNRSHSFDCSFCYATSWSVLRLSGCTNLDFVYKNLKQTIIGWNRGERAQKSKRIKHTLHWWAQTPTPCWRDPHAESMCAPSCAGVFECCTQAQNRSGMKAQQRTNRKEETLTQWTVEGWNQWY